eukprot:7745231-Pyramimonas_sp.AAC.3
MRIPRRTRAFCAGPRVRSGVPRGHRVAQLLPRRPWSGGAAPTGHARRGGVRAGQHRGEGGGAAVLEHDQRVLHPAEQPEHAAGACDQKWGFV